MTHLALVSTRAQPKKEEEEMRQQDWEALSPRRRNALVARRIMGYQVIDGGCSIGFDLDESNQTCYQLVDHQGQLACRGTYLSKEAAWLDAPPFSQSLSVAWQVVDRIIRRPCAKGTEEEAMRARFVDWLVASEIWSLLESQAAEAVCLAALRAQSVQEERKEKEGLIYEPVLE